MAQEIGNLSLVGFLDGITATGIVFFSVLFGLIAFYNARKLGAKLLSIAGVSMIFVGLFWLGPMTDFFMVLLTGNNLNPTYLYGWLSYIWVWPAVCISFYLGGELIFPKWKKTIVIVYAILGIIFEYFLLSNPYTAFTAESLIRPEPGNLIDTSFSRATPAYYLILLFMLSVFIFLVIGFAIKAIQSTGALRKKFLYLSLGWIVFIICGLFDSLTHPEVYLIIWRGAMMAFAPLMYLGLKT